ncbi:conjugal transfer protein TraD [Bacteroides uniformis]|uniref:conjugal transfer protein TraD n=1 Tax=Bacteroides uniformis TaxID=820 RepID=UPI001D071792|nr:conjugal transfer protein TraD [Bacteroides uniformis]MCB6981211.1 conjugal transfer protein TraD [Bacteroides uniformis]MCB7029412.1 conjugal transfer protein TraD [Bacteroides uniformis]
MTTIFLMVSIVCNVWFLFLLLYDRIMETKLVRFFRNIVGLWRTLDNAATKQEEAKGTPSEDTRDIIGKNRFKMTSTRTMTAIPVPQAATSEKGIELSEEDATFDDVNAETASRPVQVPEEKLDETFTSIPPSELEFGEDEPEEDAADKQRASGYSFDEIGEAVGIAGKDNPTNDEKRQAGKVFSELEGTELLEKLHKSVKVKIAGFIDFYLYDEPMAATVETKAKKELIIPTRWEDFNIRDFV